MDGRNGFNRAQGDFLAKLDVGKRVANGTGARDGRAASLDWGRGLQRQGHGRIWSGAIDGAGLWMTLWRTLCISCEHNILGVPPQPGLLPQRQKLRDCYCGKLPKYLIFRVVPGVTECGGKP